MGVWVFPPARARGRLLAEAELESGEPRLLLAKSDEKRSAETLGDGRSREEAKLLVQPLKVLGLTEEQGRRLVLRRV
jgi:hypothetical protein